MMAVEPIARGWTTPLDYQLYKNGVSFNGTGMTLVMVAEDGAGQPVTLAGAVTWLVAATSQVRFTPGTADFADPIRIRWRVRVTDGDGKVASFPKDAPNEWLVTTP